MSSKFFYNGLTILDKETSLDIVVPVPFKKTYVFSTVEGTYSYTFPSLLLGKYKTLYFEYKNKSYIEMLLTSILFCS